VAIKQDIDQFEEIVRRLTHLFSTNYALTAIEAGETNPDIGKAVQYGCGRMAQILRKMAASLDKVQ
jgi:hypothetical protein